MSIVYNRVDGRMVHGQVAAVWTKKLSIDEIIVVNTDVSKDEDQINLLELATPTGCEIDVVDVALAVEIIREGDFRGSRTMIIFKTIQDVAEAHHLGYEIKKVYIGGMYQESGKTQYEKALFADFKDIISIQYLLDNNVEVLYQVSPLNKEEKIQNIIKELKKDK